MRSGITKAALKASVCHVRPKTSEAARRRTNPKMRLTRIKNIIETAVLAKGLLDMGNPIPSFVSADGGLTPAATGKFIEVVGGELQCLRGCWIWYSKVGDVGL